MHQSEGFSFMQDKTGFKTKLDLNDVRVSSQTILAFKEHIFLEQESGVSPVLSLLKHRSL